ncbi:MAG TPA: hypothetical protein VE646_04875, partial [Actinomycetota bacterium]|nr:hypothetical protein [Actinomycetota bacterium]
ELDVSEITDGHAADVLRGIFISLDLEKPTPDGTVQFYPPGSPPWSSWVLSTILPQRSMLRADIEA